ncbi:hypothetical protein, conserved in T. vivax [Trypanosoma vivax Y486]|uniref:Uncharacterized protein n=1 Tax=Trypanosoma vivax (strain Y486) TaxID=1055687 RepID=F9WN33_TRYVY|nr:hypothetical protein, conserved in T. vivax [Trypanosoma vivax Y486]|eukprot:CCD18947.1 hypothetical protein, conserved in T. vivax [Trypanosoma vivax Y486]
MPHAPKQHKREKEESKSKQLQASERNGAQCIKKHTRVRERNGGTGKEAGQPHQQHREGVGKEQKLKAAEAMWPRGPLDREQRKTVASHRNTCTQRGLAETQHNATQHNTRKRATTQHSHPHRSNWQRTAGRQHKTPRKTQKNKETQATQGQRHTQREGRPKRTACTLAEENANRSAKTATQATASGRNFLPKKKVDSKNTTNRRNAKQKRSSQVEQAHTRRTMNTANPGQRQTKHKRKPHEMAHAKSRPAAAKIHLKEKKGKQDTKTRKRTHGQERNKHGQRDNNATW